MNSRRTSRRDVTESLAMMGNMLREYAAEGKTIEEVVRIIDRTVARRHREQEEMDKGVML